MESVLSDLYYRCHNSFDVLLAALTSPKRDIGNQMPLKDVENELDKFRLWGGNVGAMYSGDNFNISLDYRLRESPFYRDRIISFLNTLDENLSKATAIVLNEATPMEEADHSSYDPETKEREEREQSDDSDSPWDVSSDEDSEELSGPTTNVSRKLMDSDISTHPTIALLQTGTSEELPRTLEMVRFLITCLYKMPIRQPAALERLKNKLAGTTASHYQHFDVLFVRDLFPEMDAIAATRLGRLISLRRDLLIYRERHSSNLQTITPVAYEKSEDVPLQKNIQEVEEPVHEHAQSQVPSQQISLPSKATTHEPKDDEDLQTYLYPPTISPSEISRASTYAVDQLEVKVPLIPKGEDGRPLTHFLCPYCSITQTITSERSWRKHIFLDLQPYVCTWNGCALQDHFFANRNEWYQHEIQQHRLVWHCNVEEHSRFEKQEDFINHMYQVHKSSFSTSQLETLTSMFQSSSKSPGGSCNLCFRHSRNLRSHISRHLQRIALFALPKSNDDANQNSARAQESRHESRHSDGHASASDKISNSSSDSASSAASFPEIDEGELEPEVLLTDLHETGEQPVVPDSEDPQWDLVTQKFASAREPYPEAREPYTESLEESLDSLSIPRDNEEQLPRQNEGNASQLPKTLRGHKASVNCVVFSVQGDRLASASSDRTVRLWDTSKWQLMKTLEGHTSLVTSVAFSPQGERLASASYDFTVRLWDTNTGELIKILEGHTSLVTSVAFSPHGDRLASASYDFTVRLWDPNTGELMKTLEGHTNLVNSVAFSPKGDRLASASYDSTVRLWDTITGELMKKLEGHTSLTNSVAFSPHGDRLASASHDYSVRLWDSNTGQQLQILDGYTGPITSVAFSAQGDRLAAASYDCTVRILDISTGRVLQTVELHTNAVNSVAFSPLGNGMASASHDFTVQLWKLTGRAKPNKRSSRN